jgi:5-methylthioadenosine/S-adenosylhomocysteine deaminase
MANIHTITLLIKNGLIITLDPERRVITNGAVVFNEDQIVAIGKTSDLEKEYGSDEVIDASRKIIMPGLVNAHSHIFSTTIRGLSVDKKRSTGPKKSNYFWNIDVESHLDKDVCYTAGMLGAAEMLRSGITSTQDSQYINFRQDTIDGIAQSVVDSGMRMVLGRGCWDVPGLAPEEFTEDVDTAIRESEKVISNWHGGAGGRINIRVEASTLAQCTDEMIQATKELATRHNLGWAIHYQARIGRYPFDPRAGDPAMKQYHGRGLEHLQNLGVLGPSSLAIHCTPSDNREIAILAKTHTPVSHCPISNAMSGNPTVTPIPAMLERGVTIGLGTDGPSNGLDLFQAMKFCALIHKVNLGDSMAMTAEKVIEMCTIDSAKALQLDTDLGSLESGKKADIILLDMDTPGLTASLLPVKNLVYSAANGNAVDTVIIDGKVVMEDRVIKTFNEKEAFRKGEEAAKKLIRLSGFLERDPFYLQPSPWKYL